MQLDTCIGILNLADRHALSALRARAQDYITTQFSQVVQQQDFLELPVESLETILQRDDLDVRCEECVFEALMNWVRARQDERYPSLARLLTHVRLPLLEPAYFVEKVESDELIRRCSEAFPLLQESRIYHLSGREVSINRWAYCVLLLLISVCLMSKFHICLTFLTGGLRTNQTTCAALSVRSILDHWRLHQRRTLHFHCHMFGPSQTQPPGGRQDANDRVRGRVPK